jgi:hypothetical protein
MRRQTTTERYDQLVRDGFDESRCEERDACGRFSRAIRVRCSQCEALVINGIACHETGCRNAVREDQDHDWDPTNAWDPTAPDDYKSVYSE